MCQKDVLHTAKGVESLGERRIEARAVNKDVAIWALNEVGACSKGLLVSVATVEKIFAMGNGNWKGCMDRCHFALLQLGDMNGGPKGMTHCGVKGGEYVGQERRACILAWRSSGVSGCLVTAD